MTYKTGLIWKTTHQKNIMELVLKEFKKLGNYANEDAV